MYEIANAIDPAREVHFILRLMTTMIIPPNEYTPESMIVAISSSLTKRRGSKIAATPTIIAIAMHVRNTQSSALFRIKSSPDHALPNYLFYPARPTRHPRMQD